MINFVNEINDSLKNLCADEGIAANEKVFELGVLLGRHLEQYGLESKRLSYFSELDKRNEVSEKIDAFRKQIEGLLHTVVTNALKEQIQQNGSWEVGIGNYFASFYMLTDVVEQKYSIRAQGVQQPERNGDFVVTFEFFGGVREIFIDILASPTVDINVSNGTGEDSEALRTSKAVDKLCYGLRLPLPKQYGDESLVKMTELYERLSKKYLFLLMG